METPFRAESEAFIRSRFETELRRLHEALRPGRTRIERCFGRMLAGCDRRQRRALLAIVPGAAADIAAGGGPLASFLEQVQYNGRRLAKLDVPPEEARRALQTYMRLLDPVLACEPGLRAACEQLNLATVLTLDSAFYEVRETEARTLYDLSRSQVESATEPEMLSRVLGILTSFSRAAEGRLYLFDPGGCVQAAATIPQQSQGPIRKAARDCRLAEPRYGRRPGSAFVLAQEWRKRYESFWSVPLRSGGKVRGAVQFAFERPYEWLPRELRLLLAAGEHCMLALDKARLASELAESEEQVRRLASNMVEVEERERRRISRELHDETGQMLLYLRLKLEMLEGEPETELRAGLAEARAMIDRMVTEVRRLIADLSPAALAECGLAAAVRQLAQRLGRANGMEVRLEGEPPESLPERTRILLYRLLQECCSNISRHSRARNVSISFEAGEEAVTLAVEDDGVGFRVQEAGRERNSFGLAGMRERVALAGGRFSLDARPGHGARVRIELPLQRPGPGVAG